MLALILSGHFLLDIPCWLHFYQGSFSYTSRACFIFIQKIYFTHPMLPSFFVEEVSLTHPVLPSFLCGELPSFLCGELPSFLCGELPSFLCGELPSFLCGELPSFLCGEFLWHIRSCLHFYAGSYLHFYVGSFSYTSRSGFFFVFYTYRGGFFYFLCEDLLSSAAYSENNPLRKELGRSWPRRKMWKSHNQSREGCPRITWTELNKNKTWVKNGHRNESGRKEMDLRSK